MRALKVFLLAATVLVSFGAGLFWRQYQLLAGPRYLLTQQLELSARSTNNGTLPAGAVLYDYHSFGPDDISTFVLFVNTKRLDALKLDPRGQDKAFLIDP